MVIQLMRYEADPSIADGEGYRALHLAILFQHMAIAAYLLAKGEVRLYAALQLSICRVVFIVLILFLLGGCVQEVDVADCNGQTPLMLAAQKIIGYVLELGGMT